MFIAAGNYKIQTSAISHLVKESNEKVLIYFVSDRTLELTGDEAGQFISHYELFVEGKLPPGEDLGFKQRNLKRR